MSVADTMISAKLARYRIPRQLQRERWYLDIGPTKDEWKAMSADQQAVHKRWYNFYRKRRAMRELLRGDR